MNARNTQKAEEAFAKSLPDGGQFEFLAKPFTLKQLLAKVKDTMAEGMQSRNVGDRVQQRAQVISVWEREGQRQKAGYLGGVLLERDLQRGDAGAPVHGPPHAHSDPPPGSQDP